MGGHRLIVLAAGNSYGLDGFPKLLIRHPITGQTVLDTYLSTFGVQSATVVVGYRAVEIMSRYPSNQYVFNAKWRTTNNSYSLALALGEDPVWVVSADYFVDPAAIEQMSQFPDCALVMHRENRCESALNCTVDEGGVVTRIYPGDFTVGDAELLGVFKVETPVILTEWKAKCLRHRSLFVGQNLPLQNELHAVHAVQCSVDQFVEVNSPLDYIQLLEGRER